MKRALFTFLLLIACKNTPSEGSGSGGMGSGPEAPPAGEGGQGGGGGLFKYQPCDETCTGGCLTIPDGDKSIGACAAPCQTVADCTPIDKGTLICQDHKCGLSCGVCPLPDMKCVSGVCGYPLPAPQ